MDHHSCEKGVERENFCVDNFTTTTEGKGSAIKTWQKNKPPNTYKNGNQVSVSVSNQTVEDHNKQC